MKSILTSITSKTICLLEAIAITLFIPLSAVSQRTPAANAVKLTDSLVFSNSLSIPHATVTYNPTFNKYYSLRIGSPTFMLETWNQSGGLSIFQDTCGVDTRGIWWNPNTNQVERNCFNTIGWATANLNGSGNATRNFSMLFTGMKQPNSQSVGAYDYKTNTILYYNSGSVSVYNRSSGNLLSTMPLTGAVLTNVNAFSVIYTGETNFEIGVLDYVAKRVLLFNRSTGAFSGQSQLPSTAITHSQFNFCYANNRVWLLNSTLKKWNSYNIWTSLLPIKLMSFTAAPQKNAEVSCAWTTLTEINNDYFTIERSADGNIFETAGEIKGAGNSVFSLTYSLTDQHPFAGVSYYRLKQTDFDGKVSYSSTVAVKMSRAEFSVYPNPATESCYISFAEGENENCSVNLYNSSGMLVLTVPAVLVRNQNPVKLEVASLPSGIYTAIVAFNETTEQARIVVQ